MTTTWTEEDIYLVSSRAYEFATQGRDQEATVLFEGILAIAADNSYARRALAALKLNAGNALGALAVLDAAPAAHIVTPADRKIRLDALLALEWTAEAAQEFARVQDHLRFAERSRYSILIRNKQLD